MHTDWCIAHFLTLKLIFTLTYFIQPWKIKSIDSCWSYSIPFVKWLPQKHQVARCLVSKIAVNIVLKAVCGNSELNV